MTTPEALDVDPDAKKKADDRRTLLLLLGLIASVVALTFYVRDNSRAADSAASTSQATFSNAARSACITDRRSVQADAQGRELDAVVLALAAVASGNDAELERQTAIGTQAAQERQAATEMLDPDIISDPPPVGCGPLPEDPSGNTTGTATSTSTTLD